MFSKNMRVLVLETDFYARKAINSYLAWDRRTRVVLLAETLPQVMRFLETCPPVALPNVALIDARAADSPDELVALIRCIEESIKGVLTLVLDHKLDMDMLRAVVQAGANGYLLRNELRVRVAWAICWARDEDFVVTPGVKAALEGEFEDRLFRARVIPPRKQYPELTNRIREALQLCVIEGMSADLAADEMGLSPHTVRSYVKDGYRILEANDDTIYPPGMSAQEKAYMRITSLLEDADPVNHP